MSTAVSTPVSPCSAMPGSTQRLSLSKYRPRAYIPWREPVSEHQLNAHFEKHILPELSVLLEAAFVDFSESDCEEAVQDAVCQALAAFRSLRLHENIRRNTARDEIALVLAKFASSQYLAGVRFVNSHPVSRLIENYFLKTK